MDHDNILNDPDFIETFKIHIDASMFQLGPAINKKGKSIAFYSRKRTGTQQQHTVSQRELLSIIETLKEFRTIVLGQKLRIYTYHKNFTCKSFNTDRVLIWKLITEEYG